MVLTWPKGGMMVLGSGRPKLISGHMMNMLATSSEAVMMTAVAAPVKMKERLRQHVC